MEPFPTKQIANILINAKHTVLIENNFTGQLGNIISQKTGFKVNDKILKYDGRQFLRDELINRILDVSKRCSKAII